MIGARKAHELDVVELTEDLPEAGLHRGSRGTVVEVLEDPEEAYLLEFVDESGASSKLAYSVKPSQIINIDSVAKEHYERGMSKLQEGNYVEAVRQLHQAVELIPSYIRVLHESFRKTLVPIEDWGRLVAAMRFVRAIDPNYELAKNNLAIAFLNWGANEANKTNYEDALQLFQLALRVETPAEITSLIRENISTSHTALGIKAYRKGELLTSTKHFEAAFTFNDRYRTRHDLGLAYFYFADSCVKNNDIESAIMYYEWAQDTGLITPEVLNNYGCALATKGQLDDAIVMFEHALSLAPDDGTIQANLLRATQNKSVLEFITQSTVEDFDALPSMNVIGPWASA